MSYRRKGKVSLDSLSQKHPKVYQQFPSENAFYWGGRCISGPDRLYFYLTILMLVVPTGVFLGAVTPNLVRLLALGWITIIVELLLFFVVISSFLLTSLMDPGIIPRRPSNIPDSANPFEIDALRPPAIKTIHLQPGNVRYQSKYCDTCNLYRPPRAVHCGTCNNCVDRFDHHCPWLGNCVARRNYRYFLVFIYSALTNCLYVLGLSILEFVIRYNENNVPDANAFALTMHNPMSFLLSILCFVLAVFVGILAVYHCRLVSINLTTNEFLKNAYVPTNPYDRGCLPNWIFMCCPPYYPRSHRYRDQIEPPTAYADV